MIIVCPICKKEANKSIGHFNRANKKGLKLYCGRECAGKGRRIERTIEEKKKIKSEYDKKHRKVFSEEIKLKKHLAFKKDYAANPEKYRLIRQKRKKEHNEYCRRPEYKKWKVEYDKKYAAKRNYGEFAECFLLLKEIEKEYNQEEVRQINNLHNKSQKRKRKWKTQQNQSSMQRI